MDFGLLFSRAWKITWNHKALWIFGILASCASGGTGGSPNTGFNFPGGGGSGGGGSSGGVPPGTMMDGANAGSIIAAGIAIGLLIVCLALIFSLIAWVIGVFGRGALVAGVRQAEDVGGTSFSKAWSGASARIAPLLGMNVLLALPAILVGLVALAVLLVGVGVSIGDITRLSQRGSGPPMGMLAAIGVVIAVLLPLSCVGWVYSILAAILRLFAERAIVLESHGAVDGLKRGWAVFRANLGNALVLGVILVALTTVLGFALVLLFLPVLVPIIAGVATTAQREYGPLIVSLGVAGCIAVLASAASVVVSGVFNTFGSACWTLAYRDFAAKADQLPVPAA